jgi:hypothetical protein
MGPGPRRPTINRGRVLALGHSAGVASQFHYGLRSDSQTCLPGVVQAEVRRCT